MNETYNKIIEAATHHRIDLLKQFKETLSKELDSMDKFFETFLETNNLDRRKKTVSNWNTYKEKTSEYCEVSDNLKLLDFLLEKYNV